MRHIVLAAGLLFTIVCGGAASAAAPAAPDCRFGKLDGIDLARVETAFRKQFCVSKTTSPSCDARYANMRDLVGRLVADSRVPNVATAAYILATVAVETGSRDFSPAAVEIIGAKQKLEEYYPDYIGRGWIQLTYHDKYQKAGKALGIDLVGHPERALEPDTSYEILVRGMTEGWIETYRSTTKGGAGTEPIRLGDFITADKADYGLARAVINANCMGKPCRDVVYGKGYLPTADRFDAGPIAANYAGKFERLLCAARP